MPSVARVAPRRQFRRQSAARTQHDTFVRSECQGVEDLASDLARLANKMASMVANRAQAAMQGDRDSQQQLVAHGVPAYYGI